MSHILLRRLTWSGPASLRSSHRARFPSDADADGDHLGSPIGAVETDNPFKRVVWPRYQERLWVALHAPALHGLTSDEAFLTGELLAEAKAWGVRVFATGEAGEWWGAVPWLEVKERVDLDGVLVRVRGKETDEPPWGMLGLQGLRDWAHAVLPPTAHRPALEVLAAHEFGAHLVVTTDRHLLRLRTDPVLREINLVSPSELGPVMGVWARACGAGGSFGHVYPAVSMYYWALARALLPAGWPAFGAWVYGSRVFPRGPLLVELAQSVFARLDVLLSTLDEMVVVWQHEVNNDTLDRMAALMDNVLLRVWAIQDNLALVIGRWFEIDLAEEGAWSLHDKRWRKSIRVVGAGAVLKRIAGPLGPVRASEQLRHHAIHRESLGGIRSVGEAGTEARIRLPAPLSTKVRASLQSAGQRPEAWGLGEETPPQVAHREIDHGDGLREAFEAEDPGGALLDPMLFSAQLTASVARLANTVFEILDPAKDPRLPAAMRERVRRAPAARWASAEAGWKFVLTSPLAGLVPWAEPRPGGA